MKRKHGLTPIERINRRKTVTKDGCWETPYIPSKAYPSLKIDGKHVLVHRIAYEHYIGPIPEGLFVCHECDNPRCHNPDHLFPGDANANIQDMMRKGRHVAIAVPKHDYAAITALAHLPQVEIAKQVGCSQACVSKVLIAAGLGRGRETSFNKVKIGEAHGRALVTEADVRAIRASDTPKSIAARQYGISESTVYAIRSRRIWKHVK